jgi:light-regulated signal transduction histidine kinase (bacteriophytochrome)
MFKYKRRILFKKLDKEFINIAKEIEKLKLPKDFFQFILFTISELFANVKEHSEAKKVSVQIKVNKDCLMKVDDDGIGLRKSYLLNKIYPKDDASAIEFALSGLSTKEPEERGFGLYTIRKFVEELQGKMIIETGKALATIEKNKIQFKNLLREKKGVGVQVETKVRDIDFYKIIK